MIPPLPFRLLGLVKLEVIPLLAMTEASEKC